MIERWPAMGAQVPPPHATQLHSAEAPGAVPPDVPDAAEIAGPMVVENTPKPKRARSRWGRRIGWLTAMVAMGGVVAAVIIVCLKFIDGPVSTTQVTTLAKLRATPASAPTTMSLWSGQYVELKYPGVFDQIGRASGSKTALEAYNLSSRGSYERQIAISVMPLPGSHLDEDSSYKFRSINPQDYTEEKITLGGEPAVEMVKTDKTERTLFWAHQGMLLTVSATSNNPTKDNLTSYLASMRPTIRWRK